MSQESNKAAMGRLQEALTRTIQRKWVKNTTGLLPHVAAALEHAGGFDPAVKLEHNRRGEGQSLRQTKDVCESVLNEIGPDHPASVHLSVILRLYPTGSLDEI